MAISYNVEFALFYACVLALFSWLAFWLLPIIARVAYATVWSWFHPTRRSPRDEAEHDFWWDARHSQ